MDSQLTIAIISGRLDTVEALLAQGAPIDGRDSRGYTPLMIAAYHGKSDLVALLLGRGADPNAQAGDGTTASILAASIGHSGITRMLLEARSAPNLQDANGWTALMVAGRKNHLEIVQALLEFDADVNIRNVDGSTALMFIVEEGHANCARALLAKKPDLDEPNKPGSNPLALAAEHSFGEILTLLVEAGANVNAANPINGMTPLHYAAQNGSEENVSLLLSHGANPQTRNIDGATPILYAEQSGHRACARMLARSRTPDVVPDEPELDAQVVEQSASDTVDALFQGGGTQFHSLLAQGENCLQRGDLPRALGFWEEAARLDPTRHQLWHNIGLIRQDLGQPERALQAYDRALTIDPSLWQTWNNKGEVLRTQGRFEEALSCYEKALEFNPDDDKSVFNKGMVLNQITGDSGMTREARECFEKARRLGHPDAGKFLARESHAAASFMVSMAIGLGTGAVLGWGAGRLISPFIGSSKIRLIVEVLGVLLGIALGYDMFARVILAITYKAKDPDSRVRNESIPYLLLPPEVCGESSVAGLRACLS